MLATNDAHALAPNERADYLRYKFQLKNGLEQAIIAIKCIRDRRLYREEYASFEAFCLAELDGPRRHIDRLIVQSSVNDELRPFGLEVIESHARILNALDEPEDKRTAYHLAEMQGKVTEETLRSTVKVVQDIKATKGYVDTGNGEMTPITAAVDTETAERLARQKQHIADNSSWERVETCEIAAGKVATKLMDLGIDPSEMIKVSIYKRKATA